MTAALPENKISFQTFNPIGKAEAVLETKHGALKAARSLLRPYGTAVIAVTAALISTMLLQHLFPYPFLFLFFGAVMASAWFGGMAGGLFAVLLSILSVDYFFVPPLHSLAVNATAEAYFGGFVVCAIAASWVSSSKKSSEQALREARDHLGIRVAQRTAELQKSNAELRQREQQLRLLSEVIPQQIWSGTPDGAIDYCNQQLLAYVGRSMEEVQGDRFMEAIHPEDRADFQRCWRHALTTGEALEGEWRVRRADGQYRMFFTRAVPLRQGKEKPLRWYGTNTDIDEHKKAEQALLRTQVELAHLSRVLTMGELTSSIAHEINQPLAAVVAHGHACAEWLSANPPNLERARHTAEKIIQDGTRAGVVLGRIRALFKKEAPAKDWFDMNEVIQELTVFLRDEAIRRRVSIRTELDSSLPKVKGDRVQLQQVVLNLMMNGMDAMDKKSELPKELTLHTRSIAEPAGIAVQVKDGGTGLDSEMTESVFHPFFTTKPQGIGMGLTISRSIVESHRGRLWAVPRSSGGAIFQFTLPVESPESGG